MKKEEKIVVVVAEDNPDNLKYAIAGLVYIKGVTGLIEERIKIAHELFEIHPFSVAGAAIQAINQKKITPDIAIIDVDFTDVTQKMIDDYNLEGYHLSLGSEKQRLRGFDLRECLNNVRPEAIKILFTAYQLDENNTDIADLIHNIPHEKGLHWFDKARGEKDGAVGMSRHMPKFLKEVADSIVSNSKKIVDSTWEKHIHDFGTAVLNLPIKLYKSTPPHREFLIKNLMVGWRQFGWNGSEITASFSNNFENDLIKLLKQQKNIFTPSGLWLESYMETALVEYRRTSNNQKDIEDKANDFIIDFVNNFLLIDENSNYVSAPLFKRNHNCTIYKGNSISTSNEFRVTFHHALICRSIIIGLVKLRDTTDKLKNIDRILDKIAPFLGVQGTGKENIYKWIFELGLKAKGIKSENGVGKEWIDYNLPYIMEEEYDWLDNSFLEVMTKLNLD